MRRGAALAMLIVLIAAGVASAQMEPSAAQAMPFMELAQAQGVDAAALAAEMGLPDSADLMQPTGMLLRQNGLTLQDLPARDADAA